MRVYIAASLRCLIFGSAFVGMKIALESVNPMILIFSRYFIAAALINFIISRFTPTAREKIRYTDYKYLIMLGILEPIIFYMFHAYGLKYTSAIRATIILSITPIMIALLSSPILKEKLTSMKLVTIVGSMTGVYMVVTTKEPIQVGDTFLLGDLLIFLAAICHAFYTIFARKLSFKYSFFTITRFQSIIGVIGFFPLAVGEALITSPSSPGLKSILAVFYLGVVVSTIGFMVLNYTIANLSAANSSIFQNLVPGVTMVLSVLILGEYVGLQKIIGLIIILFFVFLLSWHERKR